MRGCCAPFFGRAASPSNTMWPGPRPTSVPSVIFIDQAVWLQQTWAKNCRGGGCAPFRRRGARTSSNTILPGPRPTFVPSGILIHPAILPQQTWAAVYMVTGFWKVGQGLLCPFLWGSRVLSNTMWPKPKPTSIQSSILIHATVWPQCTNVTDKTGQTGNGP